MVGGHQRGNEFGHMEVEVSIVKLDQTQERLLNLTLNKISGSCEALAQLFAYFLAVVSIPPLLSFCNTASFPCTLLFFHMIKTPLIAEGCIISSVYF